MAISINGNGTITGISAGGLPDGIITTADLEKAGTSGQILTSQGSGSAPQWADAGGGNVEVMVETAVGLSGSTQAGFTGLPATTFYIQCQMYSYSFGSATYDPVIRIGDSGGIETTGYDGRAIYTGGSNSTGGTANAVTGGFAPAGGGTNFATDFSSIGHLVKLTGNTWQWSAAGHYHSAAYMMLGSGTKTLSGTLDRVVFTSVAGNSFDNGSFNIVYYYTV